MTMLMNDVQELDLKQMENVAAGNIIDDVGCHFGYHDLYWEEFTTTCDASGTQIDYTKYICSNCKKVFYYKYNHDTGKEKRISHTEYEAYTN